MKSLHWTEDFDFYFNTGYVWRRKVTIGKKYLFTYTREIICVFVYE